MPEPEPELQATANLSPVSPAPVHTATALAVPALQETVDTIDAMVAAALAPNGTAAADNPVVDPELVPNGDGDDDVVDDDSFNDAYAEENAATDTASATQQAPQEEDTADDYAKEFDSPVASEKGDDDDAAQSAVSIEAPEQAGDAPAPDVAQTSEPEHSNQAGDLGELDITTAYTTDDVQAQATASSPDHAQEGQPSDGTPSSAAHDVPPAQAHDAVADIKQLVADLTAPPSESSQLLASETTQPTITLVTESSSIPSSALPSPSSLPPRPPIPSSTQSYPDQHHLGLAAPGAPSTQTPQAPHPSAPYNVAAVPGAHGNLPPHPSPGLVAPGMSQLPPSYQVQAPGYPIDRPQEDDYQHKWEQFLADERQYMTEAKWDRFPDGSRIFIGNLSSDKVSKRDVFDMFHKFGRLAQISLKSAYGFVQYHTVDEGRAAVDNLEGVEIKGRRIHLEISRVQDKSKKDRARSPDKGRGRERDGRRGERFNQGRDEYRSGRDPSPRRNELRSRDDQYGRGRNSFDGGRNRRRSRSPGYGHHEQEPYRRRSPSPYGRSRGDSDLDLPRRHGADVPDVQIILEPNVNRDFANWVEMTFKGKGLQTEVMYLHPRMPKDQVIQRQAAEGVHAVVDLNLRAQSLSKVPVQAFDRSAGLNNVRFDQYVDLDPPVAADIILRAKASGAARYGQQQQHQLPQQQPYGGYNQGYGHQQPPAAPSYGAPQTHGYSQQPAPQQPAANASDIAALMGQVDPATLQQLIATIQAPSQPGISAATAAPPPNGGVDLQAILGSLGGQQPAVPQHGAHPGQYAAPYGAQQFAAAQQPPQQTGPPANGDSAAQVQNIMAQLARYR